MAYIISFYDNSLLYYPNLFFVVLFIIGIIGITLISIGMVVFRKKAIIIIEGVRSNLKQTRRIRNNERKKISPAYIIEYATVSFIRIIKVIFIRVNRVLECVEFQVERIIKRIGKEILLDE
jgi:hypothetical protein